MKVVVYTLTRDRAAYTMHCFDRLRKRAGVPFAHVVVDNGSTDGTRAFLDAYAARYDEVALFYHDTNVGLHRGVDVALAAVGAYAADDDLVVKVDNDCEVVTDGLLRHIVRVYEDVARRVGDCAYVLSPRVEGIVRQPRRARYGMRAGLKIGITGHVGGLCLATTVRFARAYPPRFDLPLARGFDSAFCAWAVANGATVGYVEDLAVNHYETTAGQTQRYPEYFARKRVEEETYAEGEEVRDDEPG